LSWEAFWIDTEGRLATDCGYGPEEIAAMTLPAYGRLCRFWRDNPPTRLLLAAVIGVRPAGTDTATGRNAPSPAEFAAMLRANGGRLRS